MAIRRMFAKSITDSDDFLDLPLDVQLLYFHLGMQADDEGFLNSTRKIVRMLGVEPDALQILCDMGFLIPFPSGVVAIRHWHVNNKIRKDRYSGTQFVAEREQLEQRYVSMNGRKPVSEQRKPTLEKREPLTNHVLDKRVRRKGEGRIG